MGEDFHLHKKFDTPFSFFYYYAYFTLPTCPIQSFKIVYEEKKYLLPYLKYLL